MRSGFQAVLFTLLLLVPASCSEAQTLAITGDWQGALAVQGIQLRIVFHIQGGETGLRATMDSPDQGAAGLMVDTVEYKEGKVRIIMTRLRGLYVGQMDQGDSLVRGTWSQSGAAFPLDLRRASTPIVIRRPQEPHPPYPYKIEEVTFENKAAGITLAGTLSLPEVPAPCSAAILISGSGPQDRDETIFNHKPFKVIADYLTRHGIAVLRYDDRGTAKSSGDFASATSVDFASDVAAAVDFLKERKDIDQKRIGLIGHSEGGIIAPMVASKSKDVAFVVLLAGPSLPGKEIIILQDSLISLANGANSEKVREMRAQNERLFGFVAGEKDTAVMRRKMREYLLSLKSDEDSSVSAGNREAIVTRTVEQLTSPWFRYFLEYDPVPALRKVRCPVLALNGGTDLQVPSKINLAGIAKALEDGGNRTVTVKELPGLNHLFQHSANGSPNEYARIEETFSPEVLVLIADWINSSLRPR